MSVTRQQGVNKWLALALALCFQLQAMALIAMPCAHADSGPAPESVIGCHAANTDAPSADTHLSCAKCALELVSAGFQWPELMPPGLPQRPYQAVTHSTPIDHFYRFVAEDPLRPPITQAA